MRAQRHDGLRSRLPAASLLLICALALSLAASGRTAHATKHVARGAAVVAVASWEAQHAADTPATLPRATTVAEAAPSGTARADSYASVSSPTARTPQVRGPPGEAPV
jgi:hypothetical protein